MVQFYQNGKPRKDIIREYELTPSALDKWIKQSQTSGSFKEKDNLTPEQEELIRLRKKKQTTAHGERYFKASCADTRTKVNVIRNNAHKYSISAMCSVLQLPRSTYYYEAQEKRSEDKLDEAIQEIFYNSRNTYGTRKIKFELKKINLIVSRRKIGRIMKELGLVSVYTVAQYKPNVDSCNESKVANELNRQFQQEEHLAVVVSDLTYVRVEGKWQYVCLLVDLFNREIIGQVQVRTKMHSLYIKRSHRSRGI